MNPISTDPQLNELYNDLSFYVLEAKTSTRDFDENSVYEDIEKTMTKIRARRAELKEKN